MKNLKILLVLLLCSGSLYQVMAQQMPQYTQYMYNAMSVNPAYAKQEVAMEALILHRSQWVGLEAAPATQALTLKGRLGEKTGLGFNVINDAIGPSNQVDVQGVFSYHLPLGQKQLSFGLNAGFDLLQVDWSKGTYYQRDDALLQENVNNRRPIMGAGVYMNSQKWYAGLSVPNFFESKKYDDNREVVVDRELHFYILGGYVFELSPDLMLKPAFLSKVVPGAPVIFDISANVLLYQKVTLGTAYRLNDAVSALAGIQVSPALFVGYAYDMSTSELRKYNEGSHEIILRLSINAITKTALTPRFF